MDLFDEQPTHKKQPKKQTNKNQHQNKRVKEKQQGQEQINNLKHNQSQQRRQESLQKYRQKYSKQKKKQRNSKKVQIKNENREEDGVQEIKEKKQRRRQRKKKQPAQFKPQPKISICIPLMIKSHSNILSTEEFQHPLQQFVDEMYANINHSNKVIQSFNEEDDEGNIQYKLKLINPTEDRMEHLATQMKFRVREGEGQAYYRIGVQDNGRPIGLCRDDMFESLKTICRLAHKTKTDVKVLRVSEGIKGLIAELIVRKTHRQGVKLQIRLLLFGESGSGKSTLLGVLKSGQKDDGKGYTRNKVFIHKHQLLTGTTMTKSHHVIGFDSQGMLYNHNSMISPQLWLDYAIKLLSFIDVGGHKKAQKQLVSSLCSFFPEYALWVLSAKSHLPTDFSNLQLAKIFNLPLLVVITHMDLVDKSQEMQIIYQTKQILKELYPNKTPCLVKELEIAVVLSRITSTEDVIPIFLISNVTGSSMDLLTNFFNLLPSTSQLRNNQDLHTQFLISDKYMTSGKNILAGTVIKGNIKSGQILHIGPDQKGTFRAIQVQSIQCMRVPVKLAKCGQVCTVGIKLLNYAKQWLENEPNAIRRGMVLIQSKTNPKAAYEFLAQLVTYGKQQIIITSKYQPVINTLTTRQICSIIDFQLQNQLPRLETKKSKSIDNFMEKFNKQHRVLDNLTSSLSQAKINKKEFYKKPKQSVDLSRCSDYKETREQKKFPLSPILQKEKQPKIPKKKKEKEQIKFNAKIPTELRLRFKYSPQYITVGQKVLINELKLIGKIIEIYY